VEEETMPNRNTLVGFEVLTAVNMKTKYLFWDMQFTMFQKNIFLPLSGLKSKPQEACSKQSCLFLDDYLLGLSFDTEDRSLCSSETSVNYRTTKKYVPEESTLQEHSSL
jgi:hypothetical protein